MRGWVPHTGRAGIVIGGAALLGFLVEMLLLGGDLEWFDAYVGATTRVVRTGHLSSALWVFSKAAPFIAALIVIGSVLASVRRGTDAAETVAILTQLTVWLVLTWALKVFLVRARPGELPWDPTGDSFPSGHVLNAAFCVGTALRLHWHRRGDARDRMWRLLLAAAGLAFVAAVSFARIALARHWVTDVTGSLLLAAAFIALAPAPWPAATRRWLLVLPIVLVTVSISFATGAHIRLPSPATLQCTARDHAPPPHTFVEAIEIDDDGFAPGVGDEQFTRLPATYGKHVVEVRNGRSPILKLLARRGRLDGVAAISHHLTLLVDGMVVGVQPLASSWRALAFALPELEPGRHELELLARE